MTARLLIGDVWERLAELPDHTVDLVTTSPPFWRQRAYLPADHPDKALEIGQEASPAEYLAVLLRLTAEFRRVLSKYGSIAVELGDTMAGSGGAGGDYDDGGFRPGQPKWEGSATRASTRAQHDERRSAGRYIETKETTGVTTGLPARNTGALPKSHCQIPELYRAALTYGDWPILSGHPHPAGRWIIRNRVVWCRPNPTPGDDGDKFRRATSDIVCATLNPRRWWDGDAVRHPHVVPPETRNNWIIQDTKSRGDDGQPMRNLGNPAGAPLYDWWEIAPKGYEGAHYAVWTPEIARRLILTMCPAHVCRTCGEPRRRMVEQINKQPDRRTGGRTNGLGTKATWGPPVRYEAHTVGWSDCGHNNYRPGLVLDPFAGSGTTLAVAVGNSRDAIGIDIDARNADLARERCGMFLEVDV